MRVSLLLFCILGLTIGVNGQAAPPGEANWKADQTTIEATTRLIGDGTGGAQVAIIRMTLRGVEIRIGNAVITADSAQTTDIGVGPIPREFVLSGNVRLRTVLDLSKRP